MNENTIVLVLAAVALSGCLYKLPAMPVTLTPDKANQLLAPVICPPAR